LSYRIRTATDGAQVRSTEVWFMDRVVCAPTIPLAGTSFEDLDLLLVGHAPPPQRQVSVALP
jgi:hypothetical protein